LDIKWLKTFITAAHYENFRQAAEVLFLAQPTVTIHIKHLEERVGSRLFERSGRNIMLTSAGRRFLPHAKRILEIYDNGFHDLQSWKQGYNRKLTLAVSPLIAASILPSIVRRFIGKYPDIEVVVHVMESKEIAEAITKGNADAGLSRMLPSQPELNFKKLYEDPVVLVAAHDGGELENSPPFDVEQMLHEQMVLTHNHPEYWDDLLTELRRQNNRLRTMVVSQVHITKRFIEEGLGVSFLPRSTIRREIMEGRLLEVLTDEIRLPTAATYWLIKKETRELEAFSTFLAQFYE
jgi:LysR family transcriptional repressor of citA